MAQGERGCGAEGEAEDITVSETPDRRDLKFLIEDDAIVDMLEFVDKTEVGKRSGADNNKVDSS
jgi:hypothetical protein